MNLDPLGSQKTDLFAQHMTKGGLELVERTLSPPRPGGAPEWLQFGLVVIHGTTGQNPWYKLQCCFFAECIYLTFQFKGFWMTWKNKHGCHALTSLWLPAFAQTWSNGKRFRSARSLWAIWRRESIKHVASTYSTIWCTESQWITQNHKRMLIHAYAVTYGTCECKSKILHIALHKIIMNHG